MSRWDAPSASWTRCEGRSIESALVNACTIVSRRELARARVLVAGFREHNPDPRTAFTVLLLGGDVISADVPGARVWSLADLADDDVRFTLAGNPEGAAEAALLPVLLRALLNEAGARVVYLASTQRVLGSLQALDSLLDDFEVVLTARAGLADAEHGAYGGPLGGGSVSRSVLGVRPGDAALAVLHAWPRWFADNDRAVSAWYDGLPALTGGVGVLRAPGYGLDPWTLAERLAGGAAQDDGAAHDVLTVKGRPAVLFDFATLDPLHPERLCDSADAVEMSRVPALAALSSRHADDLLEAGWLEDRARASLMVLGDGTALSETMRKLVVAGVDDGTLTLPPDSDEGRAALHAYFNEPAEHGRAVGLTRLHEAIWQHSAELRSAYPHLDGPDGPGYAGWLWVHGRQQEALTERLLPPAPAHVERDAAPDLHEREPLWGVNVAGFFTSELGLGEAARLLIAGLDAAAVPALPVQAQLVPPCRQEAEFTYADPDAAAYPTNIVCMNGDTIAPFAREVGRSFFAGRHTIALWWWEVGEFPDGWEPAFEYVDEVWVASRHIYDAIASSSPVPVVQMTMPVIEPRFSRRTRSELGLPADGFLFMFVHDYHSTAARKNPVGLVEAFKRAFPPGSGAKLVIKSINAENVAHEHDRVLLAAADHPDITLIDAYVSAADKNAMIAACDCYVSLHRSEGFGLTVAEAMLLGKPVIATRYGGTLEFTDDQNAFLVDWAPIAVGEGAHPYPATGMWADPDIDQAAALMREVMDAPQEARARAERGRRSVQEGHSPAVAGEMMRARLRTIHDRRVRAGEHATNVAYLPQLELDELGQWVATNPLEDFAAQSRVKRAVLRRGVALTRPLFVQQRGVNMLVRDGLERIDRLLQEASKALQEQQQARFAETLAMLRRLRGELGGLRGELAGVREELHGTRLQLDRQTVELERHLAEHRSKPYVSEHRDFEAWTEPLAGTVIGFRGGIGESAGRDAYVGFEETFRGPEERVMEIQRAYVPLLRGKGPVLDVGSGRGELLDLLRAEGIEARGVDSDGGMVELARAKGHDVALLDAVEYLRGLGERSLGAIVALEVIEHLPYEELLEFLTLSRTCLRDDGVLIVETVNPHAVHAMKAFWVDLTHQHPIFPEVALELCRLAGFAQGYWFHPTGAGDFESDRNSQPVYAIVATRDA